MLAAMALALGWAAPAMSEEAGSGGAPLGAAVASEQQKHAKSVTLAPFTLNGVEVTQDRGRAMLDAFKSPENRKCKPFCVQPKSIDGATTVEVDDFAKMADEINSGKTLIVDMRTPAWYAKGTLPGAISLPYTDLTGKKTKAKAKIKKLKGKNLIAFCNGWWCGQSPTGIRALVEFGYEGKIYYFRGGSQDWADAGLAFVTP
ncbi:putative rhodanese [Magnetofaba australis IT-1]|uniref:Putative rhodanese n=2 Tax=Magnetofaba TaxID=1472292 RepID=A0A1Y2KB92_9PROT|nr:putative rhodanese [Magnetofaba australis IT-1]